MKKRIPILIDTDIGSDIDDTWAIAYALCREAFDVRGICVTGRLPAYRAAIVTRLLRELGREVPVFTGVTTPGEEIRPQIRWSGELPAPVGGDTAAEFERLIRENPGLHVVGLAPNSTLASVRGLLKEHGVPVVAMAGSVRKGYFGSCTPVPECNVVTDLAASRALFGEGLDYCMIPLDVCGQIRLTGEDYALVRDATSAAARAVMENYRVWDADYVGGARKYDIAVSSTILYDLAPLWFLEFPQAFAVRRMKIAVDAQGLTQQNAGGTPMQVATELFAREELQIVTAQTLACSGRNGE